MKLSFSLSVFMKKSELILIFTPFKWKLGKQYHEWEHGESWSYDIGPLWIHLYKN